MTTPEKEAEGLKAQIYVASKAKHRPRWRQAREDGMNIVARWIDTPDVYIGTTLGDGDLNYGKLWRECVEDVTAADVVVVYVEAGEVLKGALVEVGAALAIGTPVVVCGDHEGLSENDTWRAHPGVRFEPGDVSEVLKLCGSFVATRPHPSLSVEEGARAICLVHGQEPDDYAPLGMICGPNNEPMRWWKFYEEDAEAVLSALSQSPEARELSTEKPVLMGWPKTDQPKVNVREFVEALPTEGEGKAVDMRAVVEALGFEPDNHHNALKCPYCNPIGLDLIQGGAWTVQNDRLVSMAPFTPTKGTQDDG